MHQPNGKDKVNYMHITKAQARRFLLAHQSLQPQKVQKGKAGILNFIRHVGCIQYDPLDVVGQNAELVLQARVPEFKRAILRDLLYKDRKLLDGMDKVMSIYPTEDWPYFHRFREAVRNSTGVSAKAVRSVLPLVRAEIEERGPLSSHELDMKQIVDWDWSQSRLSRAALESMYFWGELVVHHKVHTRKFYDFAHRCLPQELLQARDPNPTAEDYQDWHVHRRIGSVGLLWGRSGEAWFGMMDVQSKQRKMAIERLLSREMLLPVQVDGLGEPLYLRSMDVPNFKKSMEDQTTPKRAIVMAPLDNMLWDRRLLKELFDFEYRWEVYVPAKKRQYGYYVLPVLYGDQFIARFEPGRDKQRGVFLIKNWWWEPGATVDEPLKIALRECFHQFINYLEMDRLVLAPYARDQADLAWLAVP